MSGEGPESIPTSADPRTHRTSKKRVPSASSAQAASVQALFAKPDREMRLPAGGAAAAARRPLRPPPDMLTNVHGSSAGAGSGEFHVYKASRRREYERLRLMNADLQRQKDHDLFEADRHERRRIDDLRTCNNRLKRQKARARKANLHNPQPPADASAAEPVPPRPPATAAASHNQPTPTPTTAPAPLAPAAAAPADGLIIHDD